MIEPLVEQIEARFAELEAQMSDPEVIGDRERYAEVGREYRELQPAQALAAEYRTLKDDLEGARELLARRATTPSCGRWSTRRRRGSRSSKRRSGWRWSSATPTTPRT